MVTLFKSNLPSGLLDSLNSYRLSNFLTDVTVSCVTENEGTEMFHCHKIVLSAASPLLSDLIKDNPCKHPVIILSQDPLVFRLLLSLIYTGSAQVPHKSHSSFISLCKDLQLSNNLLPPSSEDNFTENETIFNNLEQVQEEKMRSKEQELERGKNRRKRSRGRDDFKNEKLLPHENIENMIDEDDDPALSPHPTEGHETNDLSTPPLPPHPFPLPLLSSLFDKSSSGLFNKGSHLGNSLSNLGLGGVGGGGGGGGRVRATDPRPCPKCGKIYRSAHTLRTHLEDKHTSCPGYRCVLCGTVAKSRNSLHSHMSRQHRGISTKELPVVPMPSPFDPLLASRLLAKLGADSVGPINICESGDKNENSCSSLTSSSSTSTSPTNAPPHHNSSTTPHYLNSNLNHSTPASGPGSSSTGSVILDTYLQFIAENNMFGLGGAGLEGHSPAFKRNIQSNCIYESD